MKTILYIEDDQCIQTVVKCLLSTMHYNYLLAPSVSSALLILKDYPIDLIVLDLQLGEESGVKILEFLDNGNSKLKKIPVIITSGWLEKYRNEINNIKNIKMDFLIKPFSCQELKEKIEKFINDK